jgi:hypothetical protein
LLSLINSHRTPENLKINYGFDSFTGFPPVITEFDRIEKFQDLHNQGLIDDKHFTQIERNKYLITQLNEHRSLSPSNISLSGNFSNTSVNHILKRANILELENYKLIKINFSDLDKTGKQEPARIAGALLDCDLYQSYKDSLSFVWPRLSVGGFIYLDEYFSLKFPGARIATNEFFKDKKSLIDWHHIEDNGFERWWITKLGD